MPIIQSAKKRMRQTKKRTLRNRVRKRRLKKVLKAFDAAVQKGDPDGIAEQLRKASKAVDQARAKGILHPNAVNRRKSRLARQAQQAARAS